MEILTPLEALELITPVMKQMLDPSEVKDVSIYQERRQSSLRDESYLILMMHMTVVGDEHFFIPISEEGTPQESKAETVRRFASNLQDEIVMTSFGWGQMREYDLGFIGDDFSP